MEAASARYVARDRFATYGEPAQTPLQRYIQNAVDPQNFEPNLALNLEIADLINSKKGNTPREAAVAIVNYINHRNPNVSLLALSVLDICVKNCGYPFHLQISTKEFLNELVRRFPERPPIRASRVQLRILEAIEEWRQTICQTSRYKEDLGFIRDMHRLLSYKGYMFPEVRREDAAVLNPSDNLKSADEMEEEERAAQSAKLQELIRRGTPQDLQEANKLMKVMAGYDTKNKTDFRAKAAEEVSRIQQKAKLLEERLGNFRASDRMTEGDVFEELANSLQSAQPKIQRMCEEESDDQEAVAKLFEINDSIHRTIERYKLMKQGDLEGAARISQGTLGTSTGVGKNANNELSLIDFDGDTEPFASSSTQHTNLEDDLLGLSFQDQSYGQGGGIVLGFGANTNVPGPSLLSSTMQQSSARAPTPVSTPQLQQTFTAPIATKPNYEAFGSVFSSSKTTPSQSPTPSLPQQQQQQQRQAAKQPQSDPFGILSAPSAPMRAQSQSHSAFLLDLGSSTATAPAIAHPNGASADDEWSFSSALPEESAPTENHITLLDRQVRIAITVCRRQAADSIIDVRAEFSNKSAVPITELTFQVAVTKAYSLKLLPQSGRSLAPLVSGGIKQQIEIHGVQRGQAGVVKMRWKMSYKSAGDLRQEQGEVPPLGVA